MFLSTFVIAILFALYTDDRWEDWYITFRASRNLALGHGLVYNPGERVQTFTSPLGTLIPALLSALTFNRSEDLVMWLYRLVNATALGITGIFLLKIARGLDLQRYPTLLLLGLFSTNILIIDFSINGMETAFMMLFLSWYLYLLLVRPKNLVGQLALVFSGLMYTRPDGFIYGGAIAVGFLIFQPCFHDDIRSRKDFILIFTKAAVLGAIIFLPWVIFTSLYYGSPIPHTIVAKAAQHKPYSMIEFPLDVARSLFSFVFRMKSVNTANGMFLRPYGAAYAPESGMLRLDHIFNHALGVAAVFIWFLPLVNKKARAISFALFVLVVYLSDISGQGAMPWYVANLSLLAIVTLSLTGQTASSREKTAEGVSFICALVLLLNASFFITSAALIKEVHNENDVNNRKEIGLWLKDHAKTPHDTVMLEPFGYIGFYSGLKMYDFPGLSSPEVTEAIIRHKIHSHVEMAPLVEDLRPDWIVLRPAEIDGIKAANPGLLINDYDVAKIFDVRRDKTIASRSPWSDELFVVYHHKSLRN